MKPEPPNVFQYRVRLTLPNVHKFELFAVALQAHKEANGVKSNRVAGDMTDLEAHRIGKAGEFALGQLFNLPVNTDIQLGNDGRIDTTFYDVTIDMKTRPFGKLLFRKDLDKEFVAQVAVLGYFKEPDTVWMQGFLPREQFIQHMVKCDFGWGPCWGVDPVNLIPIVSLPSFCLLTSTFGSDTISSSGESLTSPG